MSVRVWKRYVKFGSLDSSQGLMRPYRANSPRPVRTSPHLRRIMKRCGND